MVRRRAESGGGDFGSGSVGAIFVFFFFFLFFFFGFPPLNSARNQERPRRRKVTRDTWLPGNFQLHQKSAKMRDEIAVNCLDRPLRYCPAKNGTIAPPKTTDSTLSALKTARRAQGGSSDVTRCCRHREVSQKTTTFDLNTRQKEKEKEKKEKRMAAG